MTTLEERLEYVKLQREITNSLTPDDLRTMINFYKLNACTRSGSEAWMELQCMGHVGIRPTGFDHLLPFLELTSKIHLVNQIMEFRSRKGAPPLPGRVALPERVDHTLPKCITAGCGLARNAIWGCGHYFRCLACCHNAGSCDKCGNKEIILIKTS